LQEYSDKNISTTLPRRVELPGITEIGAVTAKISSHNQIPYYERKF